MPRTNSSAKPSRSTGRFSNSPREDSSADLKLTRRDLERLSIGLPAASWLTDFAALAAPATGMHVAPLLCAGLIGFRRRRVAGVERGDRVGLFGFAAPANLAILVLLVWDCEVYVVTRGEFHRKMATSLGAHWTGDATETPSVPWDRSITLVPTGDVVIAALGSLRKAAWSLSTPST